MQSKFMQWNTFADFEAFHKTDSNSNDKANIFSNA